MLRRSKFKILVLSGRIKFRLAENCRTQKQDLGINAKGENRSCMTCNGSTPQGRNRKELVSVERNRQAGLEKLRVCEKKLNISFQSKSCNWHIIYKSGRARGLGQSPDDDTNEGSEVRNFWAL